MAADSLAVAVPLPDTVLWMVPKETGWDWMVLSTVSCLFRKRYSTTPPATRATSTTPPITAFLSFLLFCFFPTDAPVGLDAGAASWAWVWGVLVSGIVWFLLWMILAFRPPAADQLRPFFGSGLLYTIPENGTMTGRLQILKKCLRFVRPPQLPYRDRRWTLEKVSGKAKKVCENWGSKQGGECGKI